MSKPLTIDDMPERLRQEASRLIGEGLATQKDVDDALAFMNLLAEDELAGRVTPAQAKDILALFTSWQALGGVR